MEEHILQVPPSPLPMAESWSPAPQPAVQEGSSPEIFLLGDFRIFCDGKPLTTLTSAREQSLLAYLILYAGVPQSRRHLAFLLWPDSSDAQSRSNLRKLWHDLRRSLPQIDQLVEIQGSSFLWRADADYALDVATFRRAVAEATTAADLQEAVALYRGPLLQSCYDDWVLSERERLHQLFLDTLGRLVNLLESQGEYRSALHYAHLLLQQDPLHEETYRALMRLYALTDDRAAALHTFQTCASVLKRELDVEPSPATCQAYERLLTIPNTPPAPAGNALPLIGHTLEWARLLSAWKRACQGLPHWVLLTGAPGIGKTRLAEELLHWAAQQGISTAYARCYAAESTLGFGPLATWLRSRPLPNLDPLWVAELSRLWPELLIAHPEWEGPGPLNEPWQRLRFFEALERALLAKGPVLLFLDDLAYCDRDSLEWLHYLLRSAPPGSVLLVSTLCLEEVAPEHPLQGLLTGLRHTGQVSEIGVRPLSVEETGQFAERIEGREWTAAERERLYAETEGNPLFIQEMVQSGYIRQVEGHGRVLPQSVQAVIGARLAQLSPEARQVAQVAAVLGRSFSVELLLEASGLSEEELGRALAELRQRRIVRAPEGNGYDFDHSLLREVVYGELNPAERRSLHRRVAEALEQRGESGEGVSDRSGELVRHWRAAGQRERAVPFEVQAGDEARRRYANETAVGYYAGVVESLRGAEQVEALLRLGKVQELMGHWLEAEKAYGRARALAEGVGLRSEVAQCEMALGELLHRKGLDRESLQHFQRALEGIRQSGDLKTTGRLMENLGILYDLQGDAPQALAHHQLKLGIASKLGDKLGVSQAIGNIGLVYWRVGNYDRALSYYERQFRIASELDDRNGMRRSLSHMGLVYEERGEIDQAFACHHQGLEIATEIGDRIGVCYMLGNMGRVYYQMGDHGQAMSSLSRQLEIAGELRALRAISHAARNMGLIYHCRGDYTEALECYGKSLELALEMHDQRIEGYTLCNLAVLFGDQNMAGDAQALFERSSAILRRLNLIYALSECLYLNANLWFRGRSYPQAEELAKQALGAAGRIGCQAIVFSSTVLLEQVRRAMHSLSEAEFSERLQSLLRQWKGEKEQAELYYLLWRTDPREPWRKAAAKLYRKLHDRTPVLEYRTRYAELTGSRLSVWQPKREIPGILKSSSNVRELAAQLQGPPPEHRAECTIDATVSVSV